MKAQEKAVLAKLALVEADYQRAEGEDGGKGKGPEPKILNVLRVLYI